MKLAIFGATGMIGKRIVAEALGRGHKVAAISRRAIADGAGHPNFTAEAGDVLNPDSVASLAAGHDAIISAFGPTGGDPSQVVAAAKSLVEAAGHLPGVRLIVVGGAGSLEVAPGLQLVDTPQFPAMWKEIALAHREAKNVIEASNVDWTYVSPAALIEPGERTGKFRLGTNQLITDAKGESRISTEDFAVAILNELESPQFIRARLTVGY